MVPEQHWNNVYATRKADEVSWFQSLPRRSLEFIRKYGERDAGIIDVGGGASTLVDRLLDSGYSRLSVLDISGEALRLSAKRLGERASQVAWIAADVTSRPSVTPVLLWHDRAVLHFLTKPEEQVAYASLARTSILPGGHAVIATFAPDGPTRCSGLDVQRHDGESLAKLLGSEFELVEEDRETHLTPKGVEQRLCWAALRRR